MQLNFRCQFRNFPFSPFATELHDFIRIKRSISDGECICHFHFPFGILSKYANAIRRNLALSIKGVRKCRMFAKEEGVLIS